MGSVSTNIEKYRDIERYWWWLGVAVK